MKHRRRTLRWIGVVLGLLTLACSGGRPVEEPVVAWVPAPEAFPWGTRMTVPHMHAAEREWVFARAVIATAKSEYAGMTVEWWAWGYCDD